MSPRPYCAIALCVSIAAGCSSSSAPEFRQARRGLTKDGQSWLVLVRVTGEDGYAASGTGFLVEGGTVVTATHVLEAMFDSAGRRVSVIFSGLDGEQPWEAVTERTTYSGDHDDDVAIILGLAIPTGAEPLHVADQPPPFGSRLTSYGRLNVTSTVSRSAILGSRSSDGRWMFLAVPDQPGGSGGPVLNDGGEVVGLVRSIGQAPVSLDWDLSDRKSGRENDVVYRVGSIDGTFARDLTQYDLAGLVDEGMVYQRSLQH